MYGIFEINPKPLMEVADEYNSMTKQLTKLANEIDSIKNNLQGGSFEELKPVLDSIATDVRKYSTSITSLQTVMEESVKMYQLTETSIIESDTSSSTTVTETSGSEDGSTGTSTDGTSTNIDTSTASKNTGLINESMTVELSEAATTSRSNVMSTENGDVILTTETLSAETLANELGSNAYNLGRPSASDSYSNFLDQTLSSDSTDGLASSNGAGSSGGGSGSGGSGGGSGSNESANAAKQLGTGVATSSGSGKGGSSSKKTGSGLRTTANSGDTSRNSRRSAIPTVSAATVEEAPKTNVTTTAAIASVAVVLSAGLTMGVKHFADKGSGNSGSADIGKSVASWA